MQPEKFPDDLSKAIDVCLSGTSRGAWSFSAALIELESGVGVELKNGLRTLPGNGPPNKFLMPRGIPYFATSTLPIQHRRFLLEPFRVVTNQDGLISQRDGTQLAEFYATELHKYALRRLRAIPPGNPEQDQWIAAQKEASRIYFWILGDAKTWSARI